MYPLGHTLESAKPMCPFLYGNIVLKTASEPTMEAVANMHEKIILKKVPTAKFDRLPSLSPGLNEAAPRSLFRVGHIQPSYGGPEYSLYIDSPKGVLVLVLLCPEGSEEIYVPALKWIGGGAILMARQESTDLGT
jgi:hypothetical protein